MAFTRAAPGGKRLPALRRFAVAITILTVLGHSLLGFETSLATVFVALATTYAIELLLELVEARCSRRPLRFRGGWRRTVDFLLPAHISGLAIAMLLYPGGRLMPVVFAGAVAMGTKMIFRVPAEHGPRHFLNPSNAGISVTLLLFPWVGITPPYQFTENVSGGWDWGVPAILILAGTLLNSLFTGRMPLILSWLGGFAAQAALRAAIFGTPLAAALLPMTGMAFLLFTFYMISDPGTTPHRPLRQVWFGLGVAAAYGLLLTLHVVFTLFFALLVVCCVRGIALSIAARPSRSDSPVPVPEATTLVAGRSVG